MTIAASSNSVQRRRKEQMAASFSEMLSGSEAVVVSRYHGLTVTELSKLRGKALDAGIKLRVVKNSVARRVLTETTEYAPIADKLSGPLLYGVSDSAPDLAKLLYEFSSDNENLKIELGVMNGSVLEAKDVIILAKLPSRQQLLAQLAGVLSAPIGKLARTLKEIPGGLARSLSAVRDGHSDSKKTINI